MVISDEKVGLRLVEESDIELLYRYSSDVESRGAFFPTDVQPIGELHRRFAKDGFWSENDGRMIITDCSGNVVGCLYYFRPHPIIEAREIGYIIFDGAMRNRGYATEALSLFVRFVFSTTSVHRLELNIGTENIPSVRVAEKCGFVREGTLRSVWFSATLNRHLDAYRYSLIRDDYFKLGGATG